MRRNDSVPSGHIWVLFDLSNGTPGLRRYVWWFDTREQARKYYKMAKNNKNHHRVTRPTKWVLA